VDPTPLSTPVFLEPGVHVVMVRKDGFKTADRKVTAVAGATDAWDVTLLAVESAPPPVVAPPVAPTATAVVLPQPFVEPPRDSSASKPNPWILVGGGVVTVGAVVTGLVFNSKANSAYDKASALKSDIGSSGCFSGSANSSSCTKLSNHVDDGNRNRTIAEVTFAAAGTVAVATAAYWLWPRKPTGNVVAHFTPSISQNAAWFAISGSY